MDIRSKNIDLNLALLALPDNQRNNARYLTFTLSITPRTAYTGTTEDRDAAALRDLPLQLAVKLPLEPHAGRMRLHERLDNPTILMDMLQVLPIITEINATPPQIGLYRRSSGSLFLELDYDGFKQRFLAFFDECRYKVFRLHYRIKVGELMTVDCHHHRHCSSQVAKEQYEEEGDEEGVE